jgi:prepilin-type processing-associated H-X9-DG protein
VTCVSNLRQISNALSAYVQDNDSTFPPFNPSVSWPATLHSYFKDKSVLRCPACIVPWQSQTGPGPWGYAVNSSLSLAYESDTPTKPGIPFPSTTVSFCEVSFYHDKDGKVGIEETASQPETDGHKEKPYPHDVTYFGSPGGLRHQGCGNYSFVDGHARYYTPNWVWSATRGNDGQQPSFGLKPLPGKSAQ